DLLGAKPSLGRNLISRDEQPGHEKVVILSDNLWKRRFHSDSNIIGHTIYMEGETYEVVGVLSPDFHLIHVLNRELDVFIPLVIQQATANRDDHSINVYARLKANVTLEAAQSEMNSIAQKLASDYPQTNSGRGVSLVRLQENFAERVRPTLLL